jgi:hypothetical protein
VKSPKAICTGDLETNESILCIFLSCFLLKSHHKQYSAEDLHAIQCKLKHMDMVAIDKALISQLEAMVEFLHIC